MRRSLHALSGLTLLALSLLPDLAGAQRRGRDWPPQHRRSAPQLGLEGGGLFSRGSSSTTADASGFDVMGTVGSGMFSLGGGYQRSTVRQSVAGSADNVLDGFFVEPRLALPLSAGNFTPYLFGRAAWLTNTRTISGGATTESSASQVGGGVGTLIWLAPRLQLNTALVVLDTRAAQTPLDGRSLGVRAGVTIGLDRWGR
ncbi:MAG: hypothetical protein MUF00_09805 [Gemmatimonadaceae bacterium]|jgi:hypothetical protein|nr:hypothetical protein [Gemmatimonadaceae bacterium]